MKNYSTQNVNSAKVEKPSYAQQNNSDKTQKDKKKIKLFIILPLGDKHEHIVIYFSRFFSCAYTRTYRYTHF